MKKQEFMIVLIITFAVIMIWVISDIIHTRASVTVSPQLTETLEDVNPSFDQDTLNKISNLPSTPNLTTPITPTPTPSPTPTPLASPSAETSSSAITSP